MNLGRARLSVLARIAGPALLGGGLAGVSLPPSGIWPLGVLGLALFAINLYNRTSQQRFVSGMSFGVGLFSIGLAWANQFTFLGVVLLVVIESLFVALAACATSSDTFPLVSLPATLVLSEWARTHVPLGGLPIGAVALGQVNGPFAALARVGGPLAVLGGTALFAGALGGGGLGIAKRWRGSASKRRLTHHVLAVGALSVGLVCFGVFAPNGGRPIREIKAVAVQGGGVIGLDQAAVPPSLVFQRVITPTRRIAPVGLVLWPEDVIELKKPLGSSTTATVVGRLARRLKTTIVAGVTITVGAHRFLNEIVAFGPTGTITARFEKVHAVPFGEYIPWRGVLDHLFNFSEVPRDVIVGHGTGIFDLDDARVGVLVSYETFFSDLGRAVVRGGGEAILVPTNTASYRGSQMPSEELAASRIQAVSEGRDVLQSSPTGYSALIAPSGAVLFESRLGVQATLRVPLDLRSGATLYERFGNVPVLVLSGLAIMVTAWRGAKKRHALRSTASSA